LTPKSLNSHNPVALAKIQQDCNTRDIFGVCRRSSFASILCCRDEKDSQQYNTGAHIDIVWGSHLHRLQLEGTNLVEDM
jgi:hypothetical protein